MGTPRCPIFWPRLGRYAHAFSLGLLLVLLAHADQLLIFLDLDLDYATLVREPRVGVAWPLGGNARCTGAVLSRARETNSGPLSTLSLAGSPLV